ncbi:hypothetical protein JCM19238_2100 [Vibrio ponticus]|nr:hypothetical protein JCM19238_2100 [Vibrio ponticus]
MGVSATALYRHVRSKEELIELCCDYVMAQVSIPDEVEWDKYLYVFADNFREVLLSTPGSVDFIRHNQTFTPASRVIVNDILGIFRQAQFDAEVGFMAFASVFTRVTDIVQHQEIAAKQIDSNDEQKHSQFDATKLPNLAWLIKQTTPVDYDRYFADGIKITIEGLKVVYANKVL